MKIYAFSGLGADHRVFEYLNLDYELVPIPWLTPYPDESISDYTHRLIVKHGIDEDEDYGLLGLSFGGLTAIEATKQLSPKYTILVSSVETVDEVPRWIRRFGNTAMASWLIRHLYVPPAALLAYAFRTDEKSLIREIMADTDLDFVRWALRIFPRWNNESRISNLISIGGTRDRLLPPRGAQSIKVTDGGHFMIVDRADQISDIINREIKNYL